jgi:hypothetical protein
MAYGWVDVQIHISLTSALVEGDWSASRLWLNRKLGGPQSRSGQRGEKKILDTTRTWTSTPLLSNP